MATADRWRHDRAHRQRRVGHGRARHARTRARGDSTDGRSHHLAQPTPRKCELSPGDQRNARRAPASPYIHRAVRFGEPESPGETARRLALEDWSRRNRALILLDMTEPLVIAKAGDTELELLPALANR